MTTYDVVVIGASWGGLKAVGSVLAGLPASFPLPVVVAQHRDDDADDALLSRLLAERTGLRVVDADDKAPLAPGTVLISPPGYHVLVTEGCTELTVDEPVQFARPSIDVLFETAADTYGRGTVGVLLTGANSDGAAGLAEISRRGGYTIVQDPEDAERPEMPRAALAVLEPDAVARLDEIPSLLHAACGQERAS